MKQRMVNHKWFTYPSIISVLTTYGTRRPVTFTSTKANLPKKKYFFQNNSLKNQTTHTHLTYENDRRHVEVVDVNSPVIYKWLSHPSCSYQGNIPSSTAPVDLTAFGLHRVTRSISQNAHPCRQIEFSPFTREISLHPDEDEWKIQRTTMTTTIHYLSFCWSLSLSLP